MKIDIKDIHDEEPSCNCGQSTMFNDEVKELRKKDSMQRIVNGYEPPPRPWMVYMQVQVILTDFTSFGIFTYREI